MLDASAQDLIQSGSVVFVATRDGQLRTDIAFAMGIVLLDPTTLTVYLPSGASADRARRNIDDNGQITVTLDRPIDNRSLQIKGTVKSVQPGTSTEARCVQEGYRGALTEQLALVGVPRSVTRRMRIQPSWIIELRVDAAFDQTPGPSAGTRLSLHGP